MSGLFGRVAEDRKRLFPSRQGSGHKSGGLQFAIHVRREENSPSRREMFG
jgi:hypothetical protein